MQSWKIERIVSIETEKRSTDYVLNTSQVNNKAKTVGMRMEAHSYPRWKTKMESRRLHI